VANLLPIHPEAYNLAPISNRLWNFIFLSSVSKSSGRSSRRLPVPLQLPASPIPRTIGGFPILCISPGLHIAAYNLLREAQPFLPKQGAIDVFLQSCQIWWLPECHPGAVVRLFLSVRLANKVHGWTVQGTPTRVLLMSNWSSPHMVCDDTINIRLGLGSSSCNGPQDRMRP
jgi:hypothetical protein